MTHATAQPQKITVLGSTGSIGTNTLDVVSRHSQQFEIFALTAHANLIALEQQCLQWRPRFAAMPDTAKAHELGQRLKAQNCTTKVLSGPQALSELAAHPDVDIVMAAIVGATGLPPCMAAAQSGKRLLLANKEALVVGGEVFMSAVRSGQGQIIPIDSEHSAIFQCLPEQPSEWASTIDHIVLTASGGPFRTWPIESLASVTPQQACAHPNWVMGQKISVDSSTMMNKALEIIEAKWLFDLAPSQIKVVIHPQSIIHSMVVCTDASVLAQMGTPDMRVPIAYGLAYPQRIASGASQLNLLKLQDLTFEAPNAQRFPGLFLAWQALDSAQGTTTVLNAANEVAVAAFLAGKIPYPHIVQLNIRAMEHIQPELPSEPQMEDLLALDKRTRAIVSEWAEHSPC